MTEICNGVFFVDENDNEWRGVEENRLVFVQTIDVDDDDNSAVYYRRPNDNCSWRKIAASIKTKTKIHGFQSTRV